MHTYRCNSVFFSVKLSAFLLRSSCIEVFPGLYNFPDAPTVPRQRLARWHASCLECNPRNLCSKSADVIHTSYLLSQTDVLLVTFSASRMRLFLHAGNVIYVPFLQWHLRPVYFRKQVNFVLLFLLPESDNSPMPRT